MNNKLTTRQEDVLNFIVKEINLRGYPPSVREIGFALGMSSSATVHKHLGKLEEKGFIRKDPSKSRTIEVINKGELKAKTGKGIPIPLVERCVAGQNAMQTIKEYYMLPEQLIVHSVEDPLFLLKVIGEEQHLPSGIIEGDYLLVRQQQVVLNGELVVALSDKNQLYIQRFFITKDGPYLTAENNINNGKVFDDIYICGKVIGVHRSINGVKIK